MADVKTLADTIADLRDGVVSAEEVVESCLARIEVVDKDIEAWAFLDPSHARAQARHLDEMRQDGKPLGPLHGIPVGIKDIFDTADMPTEDGTVLHAGRQPHDDCTVVTALRYAGAVIMGKTTTTELAVMSPCKTRNPHDRKHSPGGSSSGSAAAVASGMVPLAVGSQTNGSTIRPAAYCGVVGFKPTHGLISRRGVLSQSRTLDQIGVFAGSVTDAALLAEILMVPDPGDLDMRAQARPHLSALAASKPPLPPRLAFVKTPVWDQAEDGTKSAFAELVDFLGDSVVETPLPSMFDHAVDIHRTIHEADLAVAFAREYDGGRDRLSQSLREMIERGQQVKAADYLRGVARIPILSREAEEIFKNCDAILTPATVGEAPRGFDNTGSPIFCTIWTLLGLPAISLPLMQGENGLPLGVQLVGPRGFDGRLLRTAQWLTDLVAKAAGGKKKRAR
ncbi:MAG TPA: amidase [Bradyrhizobium sp.]